MNPNQSPEGQRQHCEVQTRMMGHHHPVAAFDTGRQSERRERRHFRETR